MVHSALPNIITHSVSGTVKLNFKRRPFALLCVGSFGVLLSLTVYVSPCIM